MQHPLGAAVATSLSPQHQTLRDEAASGCYPPEIGKSPKLKVVLSVGSPPTSWHQALMNIYIHINIMYLPTIFMLHVLTDLLWPVMHTRKAVKCLCANERTALSSLQLTPGQGLAALLPVCQSLGH